VPATGVYIWRLPSLSRLAPDPRTEPAAGCHTALVPRNPISARAGPSQPRGQARGSAYPGEEPAKDVVCLTRQ